MPARGRGEHEGLAHPLAVDAVAGLACIALRKRDRLRPAGQNRFQAVDRERAIQAAFREVADALAVGGTIEEQLAAQQAVVEANRETYRLSAKRYEKGLDSYLSVLDAQRSLYLAERVLVDLDFLDPRNPKHLMRRLRRLFARARPDQREINILRGILSAVEKRRADWRDLS